MPVPLWLAGGALALGLASLGLNVRGAIDIESRRKAARAGRDAIRDAVDRARAASADAKRRNDDLDQARAQAALDRLELIRRRTNPDAMARQAEEMYESFAESGKGQYWISKLPGPNFGVLEGYDVLVQLSADSPEDPWPLVGQMREGIGELESWSALPDTLGAYTAQLLREDFLRGNPQLAELEPAERGLFVCRKLREQLDEKIANESDLDRSDALRAARAAACTVSGRGSLALPAQFERFVAGWSHNTIELKVERGGAAQGSARLAGTLSMRAIAAFAGIGAAIGGAVAGTLGADADDHDEVAGGRNIPKELLGCRARFDVKLVMRGDDGEGSVRGTATMGPGSTFRLTCPGRNETNDLSKNKRQRPMRWRAVLGEDAIELTLSSGGTDLRATLK